MTVPLADSLPRIWLGSWPTTRFKATLFAPGWTNCTLPLLPMLKFCQLAMRLLLFCVTVMLLPLWLMRPLPETICPPVGKVLGATCACAGCMMQPMAESSMAPEARLPLALVISDTATQVRVISFQIRR